MEAKMPLKPRPLRASEPLMRDKPWQDKPGRSVHDKLFEHSFYISALALIGLMEWYAHLMNTPRMLWAYLALVTIAIAYAVLRIPSFKARLGLSHRERDSGRIEVRSEESAVIAPMIAPMISRVTEAETVSAANSKEVDVAAAR
jgi:hypothetical protein